MTRFIEFSTQSTKILIDVNSIVVVEGNSDFTTGSNIVIAGRDRSIGVQQTYDEIMDTLLFVQTSDSLIISCPSNTDPNGVAVTAHDVR